MVLKKVLSIILSSYCAVSCFAGQITATGSGCAVGSNLVLTAYHVIDEGTDIRIWAGKSQMSAAVVDGSRSSDWALLRVDGCLQTNVLVDVDAPSLGCSVYALGYPSTDVLGSGVKFSEGSISSASGLGNNPELFQISVPIQPGNSGGPLFDSSSGRLLGVVISTVNPEKFFAVTGGALPQNLNFAVKAAVFSEALKKAGVRFGAGSRTVQENVAATLYIECKKTEVTNPVENKKTVFKESPKGAKELGVGEGISEIKSIYGFRIGDKIDGPFEQGDEGEVLKKIYEKGRKVSLYLTTESHRVYRIVITDYGVLCAANSMTSCTAINNLTSQTHTKAEHLISLFEEKYNIRMAKKLGNPHGSLMYNEHVGKHKDQKEIKWDYRSYPHFYLSKGDKTSAQALTVSAYVSLTGVGRENCFGAFCSGIVKIDLIDWELFDVDRKEMEPYRRKQQEKAREERQKELDAL